jgi:hypothetical protein
MEKYCRIKNNKSMQKLTLLIFVSIVLFTIMPLQSEEVLAYHETKSADQQNATSPGSPWSSMRLGGYVKYMNSAVFNQFDKLWMVDNLYHNRLNFGWSISPALSFNAGMRNRFIYGDFVSGFSDYANLVAQDDGLLNFLTQNIHSGQSTLLTTTFDRLNLEYTHGKITITAGRQRINWGQSFAWNPNDIFNAYSFLDFDYEERPGSDAIRVQFFPNYASVAEVAVKMDHKDQITAAALYRFNFRNYDIQVLSGVIKDEDYVLGTGWSGNIGSFGVNGETTWFQPQESFNDTTGILIANAGLNYMFSNSLSISAEGIYNGYFEKMINTSFTDLYFTPLSVKTLSFSKFSWFAQAGYPIHPLLNASMALMYLPSLDDGFILLPSLSYSASNNIEISLRGQVFNGTFGNEKELINMIFLRGRYSF